MGSPGAAASARVDLFTDARFLVRWAHVIGGIIWVGHLHFFNFVYYPPLRSDANGAQKKRPLLMPRALWWFRWAAMLTFLAGLVLFTLTYLYAPGEGFGPNALLLGDDGLTQQGQWILLGATLGTLMWFNVWFITWPIHKRMLAGEIPIEEVPAARKRVFVFSRLNTYLSGPMLIGMLAPSHYGAMSAASLVVFMLIAIGAMWLAIRFSPKYGSWDEGFDGERKRLAPVGHAVAGHGTTDVSNDA